MKARARLSVGRCGVKQQSAAPAMPAMHAMEGPQPQMSSLSPCLHYFPPTSLRAGLLPQEWPQVAKLPLC